MRLIRTTLTVLAMLLAGCAQGPGVSADEAQSIAKQVSLHCDWGVTGGGLTVTTREEDLDG